MKISQVKKRYINKWILAEVLSRDPKTSEISEVKVLEKGSNREKVENEMKKSKSKDLFLFYAGKIPKRGYALAF